MAERAVPALSPGSRIPLAALGGAIAVALATSINPLVGLAFLGPIAAALVLLNPAVSVPLLIVSATLDRLGVAWGDAQIRLDIVAALLLAVVVANQLAVRTLPARALRSPLALPILGYLLVNVAATVLFATERTRGLKLDAEILAAVLAYLVAAALFYRQENLTRAVRWLWIATTVEAAFGIIAMLLYFTHFSPYGVQMNENGYPMAYGTQWEANIFGSFLMGNFMVLLGDYIGSRRTALKTLSLVIIVLGIGVSMTRTVWLALIVSIVIFLVLAHRARRDAGSITGILIAIPVVALAALVVGSATPLATRMLALLDLQSSSAAGRFVWFGVAMSDWRAHPILGNGTGSFNYNPVPGQPHPWLPNLFLLTLHDTGVVGLIILLAIIVLFYRSTWRLLRPENEMALLVAGSMAGFTGLLLAFQMTTGFWFAYPWIVAAIGVRAHTRRIQSG